MAKKGLGGGLSPFWGWFYHHDQLHGSTCFKLCISALIPSPKRLPNFSSPPAAPSSYFHEVQQVNTANFVVGTKARKRP